MKKVSKLLQKYKLDEVRKMIVTEAKLPGDLEINLRRLGNEILSKIKHGNKKEEAKARKEFNEISIETLLALETESHAGLMVSFEEQYRGMAKELAVQIIRECDCQTSLEKMQVEIIVNAFIRTIEISKRLNNCLNAGEYITPNRTQYLAILSKQIDRSNRQYLSAVMTLKQMKAPTIEMNIKAKTAFVSQNQQINAQTKNNETK